MPYSIVGYFDSETDLFIRSIWKDLANNDICNYLHTSENNPHIKFSMYTELDLEKAESLLAKFTQERKRLDVHLKNYGFYPNERPILFLDFSATIPLIELEIDIQKTFNGHAKNFDFNFFDENIWKPDCFLTIEIDRSKFQKGIMVLLNKPVQFNGTLDRLGIIEFPPAKQLVSFDLS